MYPVALDFRMLPVAIAGSGPKLSQRVKQLSDYGAAQVELYEDRLPTIEQLRRVRILMVVGLNSETSARLASQARAQQVLVNVEDIPHLCDFYFMSLVKRGALSIAVSTSGASPVLGQMVRDHIAGQFGEEWEAITAALGQARAQWKMEGLRGAALAERTREWLAAYTHPALTQPSPKGRGLLELPLPLGEADSLSEPGELRESGEGMAEDIT